ncbi:hypothetical protein PVAG01_03429 [Phlyctema vagabunda]|uniref:Uncharacterized protein n=1 Tax=Phlyctema vagabunda TaxID=108571 RepID=A0ABR4PLM9_9HELO
MPICALLFSGLHEGKLEAAQKELSPAGSDICSECRLEAICTTAPSEERRPQRRIAKMAVRHVICIPSSSHIGVVEVERHLLQLALFPSVFLVAKDNAPANKSYGGDCMLEAQTGVNLHKLHMVKQRLHIMLRSQDKRASYQMNY